MKGEGSHEAIFTGRSVSRGGQTAQHHRRDGAGISRLGDTRDRDHGRCVCGKLCYPGRGDLYHDGQNEAGPIRPAFNAGRPFLSLLRLQAKRPATTLPESMTAESDSFPEMTSV